MKFYVAAKLQEYKAAFLMEEVLKYAGHEITFSWATLLFTITGGSGEVKESLTTLEEKRIIANQEINGVFDCDIMILLPHPQGKGQYVEMGVCLAQGKPVYVVREEEFNDSDLVFFFHGLVKRVKDVSALLLCLNSLQVKK